jgi:pimeloyl-ACP methyl ester carboxylesterase
MTERIVQANGVPLCTEPFGDGAAPPILLIMGIGASMLWWEEDFCRMLADRGRFVVRYDHRDTGRSVTDPPGRPSYTGTDLTADAIGVLDAYGITAAHLVGVSAGGGIAQELALDQPDRVRSLTLISTSPVTPGRRALPPPAAEFAHFVSTMEVDWSDSERVIDHLVGYWCLLAGKERPFDDAHFRALAGRDVARARDFRSSQNHDLLRDDRRCREPLSSISSPTLVIHGTADPLFPVGHGEALAGEIRDARMLRLEGAGHGVYRADWGAIVGAIAEHTAPAGGR